MDFKCYLLIFFFTIYILYFSYVYRYSMISLSLKKIIKKIEKIEIEKDRKKNLFCLVKYFRE